MTLEKATLTLDSVIPAPGNKMVDAAHMEIAQAWEEIKSVLKTHRHTTNERDGKKNTKQAMECVKLAMEEYKKETGAEQLEDGESIVAVFDNCTIVIIKEDGGIKIKLIEGKPIRVYADCDVYADREGRA